MMKTFTIFSQECNIMKCFPYCQGNCCKIFQFCFVIFSVGVPGGALRGSRDGGRPLDGQVAFGLTAVLFQALFVLLEALRVNI